MATQVATIETLARLRLQEPSASFWSSAELIGLISAGIRDLWRDVVELQQEHFLSVVSDVILPASSNVLINVPTDIHKIYMIEPANLSTGSSNIGLYFKPLDYNDPKFQNARSADSIDPQNDVIYYAITGAGGPIGSPIIRIAPRVTSQVTCSVAYIPNLPTTYTSQSIIPIPGEVDNALVAWTVAYAMAKQNEDLSPDANWLGIYATEKAHILNSLGSRQVQEDTVADALFEVYW